MDLHFSFFVICPRRPPAYRTRPLGTWVLYTVGRSTLCSSLHRLRAVVQLFLPLLRGCSRRRLLHRSRRRLSLHFFLAATHPYFLGAMAASDLKNTPKHFTFSRQELTAPFEQSRQICCRRNIFIESLDPFSLFRLCSTLMEVSVLLLSVSLQRSVSCTSAFVYWFWFRKHFRPVENDSL